MTSDVISRGARGAGVTVLGQVITMAIQFVGAIVMSRLLTPEDFGLVAMVAIFVGLGELLRDFGMPLAALQARKLSDQQASNVFWVTTVLSFSAGALLAATTPLIVLLYNEPRLSSIVPVMAVMLLLNGLQAQYQVRLARAMRFTPIVVRGIASQVLGLAAGITSALLGWEYWALILQTGTTALAMLITSMALARWLPSRPRRGSGSMALLRAGGNFGAAQLLYFGSDNVDNVAIGIQWGADVLGIYNRAFQLFMRPITAILAPLTRVIVPMVNRAIDEGREASPVLLRVQSAVCGAAIWSLLVTAATADWLVPLLLGDQWAGTAPLIQILAIGGAMRALSQTNYWAYIVNQQSRQFLLSSLATKPLQIALMIGGSFISVEAVAWGFVIGNVITWPVNLVWLRRTTGQDSWAFAANGMRLLVAAVVSFAATHLLLLSIGLDSDALAVVIGVLVSSIVYFGVILLIPGGRREFANAVSLARTVLRPR